MAPAPGSASAEGPRRVACLGCRYAKRRCEPDPRADERDDQAPCKRCRKLGEDCQSPSHYSYLESFKNTAVSPPRPSSTTNHLAMLQLASSLIWHLRTVSNELNLRPIDGFSSSFIEVQHKASEIAAESERARRNRLAREREADLLALADCLNAARVSVHSAVVGAHRTRPPDFSSSVLAARPLPALGERRRDVVLKLRTLISDKLEELSESSLDDDLEEQARLSLFNHIIQWKIHPMSTDEMVHRECATAARQSASVLQRAPPDADYRDGVMRAFGEGTTVHLMVTVRAGLPLLLTTRKVKMATPPSPTEHNLHLLDPSHIKKVLTTTESDGTLGMNFMLSIINVFNSLCLDLVAPPLPKPLSTLLRCSTIIIAVLDSIEQVFDSIYDEYDSPSLDFNTALPSLRLALGWTAVFPSLLLPIHRRLEQVLDLSKEDKAKVLADSRTNLGSLFGRAADYTRRVLSLELSPAHQLDALDPWSPLLNDSRGAGLDVGAEYLRLSDEQRSNLFYMLQFSAFSAHPACEILKELDAESDSPRYSEEEDVVAKDIVSSALVELEN